MSTEHAFAAPWGSWLRNATILASILIAAVALMTAFVFPPLPLVARILVFVILSLVVACSALGAVRGYRLENGSLYVRRLLRDTKIGLSSLRSVEFDPQAMNGSVRLWGNAGLFAYTGIYRSAKLGNFRVYLTDFNSAVVIKLADKIVVVSPDNPAAFIQAIKESTSKA